MQFAGAAGPARSMRSPEQQQGLDTPAGAGRRVSKTHNFFSCMRLQSSAISPAQHSQPQMLTLTHMAHIILEILLIYAGRGTGASHRRSLASIGPAPPGELVQLLTGLTGMWSRSGRPAAWTGAASVSNNHWRTCAGLAHCDLSGAFSSPTEFPQHQEQSMSAGPTTRQGQAAAHARLQPLPGATAEATLGSAGTGSPAAQTLEQVSISARALLNTRQRGCQLS